MEKFNIDLDNYDHTNVITRPVVLINRNCKQRIPYLTVIHLWGKCSDYLLSSRHEPLKIGLGERGFYGVNNDVTSSSDSTPAGKCRARKSTKMVTEPSPTGIAAVIKSVIDLCDTNSKSKSNVESSSVGGSIERERVGSGVVTIDNFSLPELYTMIEQHKLHMDFLKENELLLDGKKEEIVGNMSYIFEIIEGRRVRKRNCSDDEENDGHRKVSN